MTKKEESVENRIAAAETLAYLIATSASLQRIAAISNHLIPSMATFLNFEENSESTPNCNQQQQYSSNFYFNRYQQQHTLHSSSRTKGNNSSDENQQENFAKRMRQAAFRVSKGSLFSIRSRDNISSIRNPRFSHRCSHPWAPTTRRSESGSLRRTT